MKRFLVLIFPILFLGCHPNVGYETLSEEYPVFSDIYLLEDTFPDSALRVFNVVSDTMDEGALRHSPFLFFEYQVLKSELAYINHLRVSSDSLVDATCVFYDSLVTSSWKMKRDKFVVLQQARSFFYRALMEEWNKQTYIQSFSDYLKSLWIMDGLAKKRHAFVLRSIEPEYERFTGLIYERLAWLLYNHDLFDVSIVCLERSNECFERGGNFEGMAYNYDLMGDVMLAQENRAEAVRFYAISDSVYLKMSKKIGFYDFASKIHRAISASNSGDKDEAKALLYEVLTTSRHPWSIRRSHFGLAYVYYDLQQYDSALFHYEQSIPLLPRQNLKSYSRIIQLSNMLGDSLKAAYYGELLADSYFDQISQGSQNTRLVSMFENYKSESKDVRNRDIFFFIMIVLFVLAAIIISDSIMVERRRRKHKSVVANHERIKASLEGEIEFVKNEALLKDGKIRALEEELERRIDNPDFQKLPFEEKMATLLEMPISKRVRKVMEANVKSGVAYPELALSDNQMNMLVNAVDAVFPKFSMKIIELYPRLKRSDVVYCCMYVLGISEIQAAALTGKTYQAVWKRSLKIHSIFGNKADLQFVLHDILRNWK